jgi:hypothetical protein
MGLSEYTYQVKVLEQVNRYLSSLGSMHVFQGWSGPQPLDRDEHNTTTTMVMRNLRANSLYRYIHLANPNSTRYGCLYDTTWKQGKKIEPDSSGLTEAWVGCLYFFSFRFPFFFLLFNPGKYWVLVMKDGEKGGGNKMHDSFLSLLALYMLGLFAPP